MGLACSTILHLNAMLAQRSNEAQTMAVRVAVGGRQNAEVRRFSIFYLSYLSFVICYFPTRLIRGLNN